jgi:hypothetical protein
MQQHARLRIPSIKVSIPLAAAAIPKDLVPAEGPPGEPTLELALEGSSIVVLAKLSGKNYRRMVKNIVENGPDAVALALQGNLRPPASPGGPFTLESAGFNINIKNKPATQTNPGPSPKLGRSTDVPTPDPSPKRPESGHNQPPWLSSQTEKPRFHYRGGQSQNE